MPAAGYDAIVLGLGGMGSAAAYELARRGRRVLGLDQYPLVHSRGSSHGQTRIIRTAYYEHPDYVPLVRRAFDRWRLLEAETGRHLLTPCDCLTVGPADGELVRGLTAAAMQHSLPVERVTDLFPFRVPDDFVGVRESQAGFLFVEECVRAHLDAARSHGAELHADELAVEWKAVGDGVEVRTGLGTYRADRLVVTAGAWATRLLADLGVPLTVMRQTMLWFAPHRPEKYQRGRFPVFLLDTPGGAFYGLPMIDDRGVKLARHYGAPELPNPDGVNWDVTDEDERPVRAFLDEYLPGELGRRPHGQACLYTLTPDRHFVLDVHPRFPQVAVAAGFSGHGFKFAAVVGEILADLAERGTTSLPIDLFRAGRFTAPGRSG